MCFICRRGTKALYLVIGAASSSILPSDYTCHQLYCLVYKKKKEKKPKKQKTKAKQLGILGYFQLSLLPSANVPGNSTQYRARACPL